MLKYYCANIGLLEDEAVFEKWFEKMNMQRKEKILRCKKDADKKRSLMAGILLKYALEKEGLCYETLEFSNTSDGKPVLVSDPEIHFSISHSNEYVGCLIGDSEIGLDIEYKYKSLFAEGKEYRLEHMAKKSLAPTEWERFSECTKQEKERLYLEYWTKKESYSKAIGKGLRMDFSQIDTETNPKEYWSVWTTDDYCVSIYKKDGCFEELLIEKLKAL